MPPPEGENRCHGGCNVGQQPVNRAVQDWEIVGRPQTRCQVSHHQPPSRDPAPTLNIAQRFEAVMSHIPAMRLTAEGFEPAFLDLDESQRLIYRSTATDWEKQFSRILTVVGASPVVDDVNTVV